MNVLRAIGMDRSLESSLPCLISKATSIHKLHAALDLFKRSRTTALYGSLVIVRIVDKRRGEKGYEYQVCWKRTWLRECELRNAQELLWESDAKRQAQRGGKRRRPAHTDKGR